MRLDPLNPAHLVEMTPTDFELQVQKWLASGAESVENCHVVHQEKISGQGGEYAIDVVVRLTLFSGAQVVVIAECKHQVRPVVRDTAAHKGMLFSTSGFQEGAIKLAQARGIATITVIDGRWLYETKSSHPVAVVPAWLKLPRFAGQSLIPLQNGYSCHTIDDEQVDAIRDFLHAAS